MEHAVKELRGYSGSKIFLMEDESRGHFVRKIGNVMRNAERYAALAAITNVPAIYRHDADNDVLDMEYIHGLDMKAYLLYEGVDPLIKFLRDIFGKMSQKGTLLDYNKVFELKLGEVDLAPFGFTKNDFMERAPRQFHQSLYHGDLTLENILFSEINNAFYLIDPLTSEYDSYVFDLAKLQQDIRCGWFVRDSGLMLGSKLRRIYNALSEEFGFLKNEGGENDMLLILMLLRVYLYCQTKADRDFIVTQVRRLWK